METKKIKSYCHICGKNTEKEKIGKEGIWGVYRCLNCGNLSLLPD
ncbi:MAG: hypothetical protein RQ968_04115 [Thermoproteota archaeon]|jgi:uncharacterized Zn finger protein|nr:hypothetical protein [Thermoproteota archaeon]MDT7886538.1 hypothetical protein [Thermoproteota archaeon]